MQRCLVQWVSGGKKPSGHPADRGMACCPDACCSRTRNKESFWRPWPPLSPWILDRSSPPFHRSPVPCRAVSCVRSIPLSPSPARVRSPRMEARTEIEKVSRTHGFREWPPRFDPLDSINRTFNVLPEPEIDPAPFSKIKFFCICYYLNIKEEGMQMCKFDISMSILDLHRED